MTTTPELSTEPTGPPHPSLTVAFTFKVRFCWSLVVSTFSRHFGGYSGESGSFSAIRLFVTPSWSCPTATWRQSKGCCGSATHDHSPLPRNTWTPWTWWTACWSVFSWRALCGPPKPYWLKLDTRRRLHISRRCASEVRTFMRCETQKFHSAY